ncbi:hypothetical protein FQN54_007818 [Arachnomyces sp. PD_36]|nr:hypothetical protein FQN54_007818 [Arachnomyces sp. PD_36]
MKPATIVAALCFSLGALAAPNNPRPEDIQLPEAITKRTELEKRGCYEDCLGNCGTGTGGFVIGCTIETIINRITAQDAASLVTLARST